MLFVGRGGQGVVLASQILAETFGRAGFWAQSFPEFKAERRGAPISAFLRWDTAPIHRRYKVRECDVLVDVSPSEPEPELLRTVRPGGLVVLDREARFPHAGPFEVARVPASRIARTAGVLSAEGRELGNVALLGACVRLLLPDGLRFLEETLAARLGAKAEANLVAAREGYARVRRQRALASDTPLERAGGAPAAPRPAVVFPVSTTDSRALQTGSWSLDRPVLGDACTACALCALFCPEGAISRDGEAMVVDYLYCKGCGICEVVCPVKDAVAMEAVGA
jgi:2-oxoacid:acceptor oxidoreductase gamma subunit (pyruvate/2-ketoisovalerate family)/2-oxoacid:acceptor oxidoreductase delta subunit (pyruvate/2-ketoisovalerate family)